MPTDTVVLERTLIVMAVCMAVQTLMCIAAAVGAFIAWRKTTVAVAAAKETADAQIAELRAQLDRVAATVDDAARAIIRGASAVDDVVTDARSAVGRVGSTVGTVASVVSGKKTALAIGLFRGYQAWRKRKDAQRLEAAATSEL
jgi:hypothetical protein